MKHGKRLTRKQKEFLTSKRLDHKNWLNVKNTSTEMIFVHRISGKTSAFYKEV
ncbi:hypothetical protein SAMN05660297_02775 [Natronincola peptidivorans]|uniref:DUF6906 domain-containing protein n=1 Tax=Natronincola peptidivorans TaxID=426128 RepID=A0A1I0FE66_9FIRM|nr:hypothetical protein SAMN05660297_02775 [Natronincola peptidivorans]